MTTRALLLTELFPPFIGGSSELFWNIYSRLEQVPVTVLADGHGPVENPSPGVVVLREAIQTSRWGLKHPAALSHHLRMARRLIALNAESPGVLHCGRALPEGLDAWLASRLTNLPYLCWTHGEELAYAQSSRELGFWMRRVHRGAAILIANSRNTARMLTQFGADEQRIEIVYPGVDAERFRPDVAGAAEIRARLAKPGECLLITVGRLQKRKGHDLVLRALPQVLSRVPHVRYAIVGDGIERAALEQLATSLGVQDRVEFVGAVASQDLPAYFAAGDVFVHPNRVEEGDFEGFGIVFLEAAAAGRPTVAGNSGGAPEAVVDGETGLLVSGTDPDELADRLVALALNPSLCQRLGDAGRLRALREFSWDRAAIRLAAIHERISSRVRSHSGPVT